MGGVISIKGQYTSYGYWLLKTLESSALAICSCNEGPFINLAKIVLLPPWPREMAEAGNSIAVQEMMSLIKYPIRMAEVHFPRKTKTSS